LNSHRVLIVDDHARVRASLRMVLEYWSELTIVGEAQSGEDAIDQSQKLHPDVVLLDLDMPGMDGVEATKRLRQVDENIRILILTASVEYDRIEEALEAGASGYVLKTAPIEKIGNTLIEIASSD
jgi:DNA-binding NarL/FixJ family response regulator